MLNIELLQQLKADIIANKEKFDGTVKGTTGRYGFVYLDDGREIFLPPEQMKRVLPGDRVRVTVEQDSKQKKEYAEILELVETPLTELMGHLSRRNNSLFLEPDHPRLSRWLFIPPKLNGGAREGDLVRCQVTEHPFHEGHLKAKVLEVIGSSKTEGIEALYTIAKHKLPNSFSEEVISLAEKLDETHIEVQLKQRKDLTHLPFVTIDSTTTRDMDDALYAETSADGWRLQVAIADPAAWLEQGSVIDLTAQERGTTTYLPGCPVPMLPTHLSEELCSLVPEQNRLALVCTMEINQAGEVSAYTIEEAVIQSHAKLNYDEVSAYLDGKESDLLQRHPNLAESLQALQALHPALNSNRELHAILFEDKPDYMLELNEAKQLVDIHRVERNSAQRLVEECMIATNLSATDMLIKHNQGLFITHPGFKSERMDDVNQLVSAHLPSFDLASLQSVGGYKALLNELEQLQDEAPLRSILSRCLERSLLSFTPAAHYGLGFNAYTTFTSPIRKYNDLCVHRMIKSILHSDTTHWTEHSPKLPEQLQLCIQRSRKASSEVEAWLKCQYLEQKREETFTAHIVGVMPAGFNVRLDDTGIEGFVSIKPLGQKFSFDRRYHRLSSKQTTFELDQSVTVKVFEINTQQRSIQFNLAKNQPNQ